MKPELESFLRKWAKQWPLTARAYIKRTWLFWLLLTAGVWAVFPPHFGAKNLLYCVITTVWWVAFFITLTSVQDVVDKARDENFQKMKTLVEGQQELINNLMEELANHSPAWAKALQERKAQEN